MDLTLEQRLLRFLAREEDDERRAHRELHSQPVELRVLDGECIAEARYLAAEGGRFRFHVEDNPSKFRSGDKVLVGDGHELEDAAPLVYGRYDARAHQLVLERDPFVRGGAELSFEPGAVYVVDRRALSLPGRLREAVAAAFAAPRLRAVLLGEHEVERDQGRYERAVARLQRAGLNAAQVEAGARAIATQSLALVQGPPGTGKTRLLAEVAAALCAAGCRIALCAFTHRAVDNALLAIRAAAERLALELPVVKLGKARGEEDRPLRAAGVQFADPRRGRLPERGAVIAGTCYQLVKLGDRERFHYTVFDEAGQLPIPHALPGLLRAQRWILFGDHQQLPPVVTAEHRDQEASASVFAHLNRHYGSVLLDTSYRMNDGVCRLISETFYDGRLRPAPQAARRRLPFSPGGRLDEVLDPERAAVWLRVDHRQPGARSVEEANAVADVVEDLVRQHGVAAADIAVVAPFRAQVRLLRSALQHKALPGGEQLTVDTVERVQGQEREVVVVSLTSGDGAAAQSRRSTFHLSENRLNVALSRARTKVVVVASGHVFAALPRDVDGLRAVARSRQLRDRLAEFDLTRLYVEAGAR